MVIKLGNGGMERIERCKLELRNSGIRATAGVEYIGVSSAHLFHLFICPMLIPYYLISFLHNSSFMFEFTHIYLSQLYWSWDVSTYMSLIKYYTDTPAGSI